MKVKVPRPEKFAVGTKCAFVLLSRLTVPLVALVRVIVPGLEVFAMDPARRGERVKHAKNHRLSRAKP